MEPREKRILSAEDMTRLLAKAGRYRPLIATALFSGLRIGKLLGLIWDDIDLDTGIIHVRRQLDPHGNRVQPKTPKPSVRS